MKDKEGYIKELAVAVGIGCCILAGIKLAADTFPKEEPVVEEEEVVVEEYPLNGVFYCEFYKTKTAAVENIIHFEVVPIGSGWNWTLYIDDGAVLFFTQTAGQFCYINHVE